MSGASPAVPRDERLLEAERAEWEARQAQRAAEEAKAAAEEATAKAVAAKAAAEKSRAELAAAREEAKAKARAAALQVRMEHEQRDEELAHARIQSRAQRDERLGTVHPVENDEPRVVTITKPSTDRFFGACGLFLVRIVLAAFTGIVGWQAMVNRPAVVEALTYTGVNSSVASSAALFVGILLLIAAFFMLIGLATRLLSIGLLAATGAFLAFFRFGPFSPFLEGKFGFYGDREVLLATLFLVMIFLGAGGWSLDAGMRRRRRDRDMVS